jgi:hypothetical protein
MRCAETPARCRERTTSAPLSGRISIGSIHAVIKLSAGTHTPSFCFGPSSPSGRAIPLHSNTRITTGRQTLKRRRTVCPRTFRTAGCRSSSRSRTNGPRCLTMGALIARSSVSTGTQGHPTSLGVFSVISKQRWHRSNIYSAAPMPSAPPGQGCCMTVSCLGIRRHTAASV